MTLRATLVPKFGALLGLILSCGASLGAESADCDRGQRGIKAGTPLRDALDVFRRSGLRVVYGSQIVSRELLVSEPGVCGNSKEALDALLEPLGLAAVQVERSLVVTLSANDDPIATASLLAYAYDASTDRRISQVEFASEDPNVRLLRLGDGYVQLEYRTAKPSATQVTVAAPGYETQVVNIEPQERSFEVRRLPLTPVLPAMPNMIVSTSRYELLRELLGVPAFLSRSVLDQLPNTAGDPIRATRRVPGVATGGLSAKPFVRGGAEDEVGVILNGHYLIDPFHVRDYQNLVSVIDQRAIDGLELYTGGFPVRYGDRMSGMILLESLVPSTEAHTELGLSAVSSSLLSIGRNSSLDFDWLVSARRGNLDLIIDERFGRPYFWDFFASAGRDLDGGNRISGNLLVAQDEARVITENDIDEIEQSVDRVRNTHGWLRYEGQLTDRVSSEHVLSATHFSRRRIGQIFDPAEIIADLSDSRHFTVYGIKSTFEIDGTDDSLWTLGFDVRRQDARYDYRSAANYFGTFLQFQDVDPETRYQATVVADGTSVGAYAAYRWRLSDTAVAEAGLRWDHQTYAPDRTQVSPRFSYVQALSDQTDFRVSAGRYHQSQAIHELQIADGITEFQSAQRADHLILGLDHRQASGTAIRLEAYLKEWDHLRPRFENLLDPLAVLPELEPDRTELAPDSARSYGAEVSLSRERETGLSWWMSYGWSHAYDRIDGQRTPRSWDQRHALKGGISWARPRWVFTLSGLAHSGWPRTNLVLTPDNDSEGILNFGSRNADRFSPYLSLDARIEYSRSFPAAAMTVFFEVSNLTNRENACCVDFDLDAGADLMPLLSSEADTWAPRLPFAGIRVDF